MKLIFTDTITLDEGGHTLTPDTIGMVAIALDALLVTDGFDQTHTLLPETATIESDTWDGVVAGLIKWASVGNYPESAKQLYREMMVLACEELS